jgi:hypothetical protein
MSNDEFYSDLAYRWAPVHYQYVNPTNVRRDMLCSVDYDGDWDTSNNRIHLSEDYNLIPVVYYATAETSTHYYVMYCFYHADDATHENDLEGCLLIIEKEDRLLGMISIAHFDFYSFVVGDRLQAGLETIDGELPIEIFNGEDHPMTKQHIDKHPLFAWGSTSWMLPWVHDSKDKLGIRYYPAKETFTQDEFKIDSINKTDFPYVLVDILGSEGFWDKRKRVPNPTFKERGIFNSSTAGSAHAPWLWSDKNWPWDDVSDALPTGTIFFDPAKIAFRYFSGFNQFNAIYTKRMNKKVT